MPTFASSSCGRSQCRGFFIFSLVFPMVLYFPIAGPNRNVHALGGRALVSALFMVGIAALGPMAR